MMVNMVIRVQSDGDEPLLMLEHIVNNHDDEA